MAQVFLVKDFIEGEKVAFYTIQSEDKEDSETDLFIERFSEEKSPRFTPSYEDALGDILVWIDEIGTRGLSFFELRFENKANALPPKRVKVPALKPILIGNPPLRLFCIVLSEQVIVLCGGGIKSGPTVKSSSDLHYHFRLANKVAEALIQMIKENEISVEGKSLVSPNPSIDLWLP